MSVSHSAPIALSSRMNALDQTRKLDYLGISSQGSFPWSDQFSRSSRTTTSSSHEKSPRKYACCPLCYNGRAENSQPQTSWEVLSLWVDLPDGEGVFPTEGLLPRLFPERVVIKQRLAVLRTELVPDNAEDTINMAVSSLDNQIGSNSGF